MPIIDTHTRAIGKRVEPLAVGGYDAMSNPDRRDMSIDSRWM